jgi:hypothetical protein
MGVQPRPRRGYTAGAPSYSPSVGRKGGVRQKEIPSTEPAQGVALAAESRNSRAGPGAILHRL